MYGKIFLDKIKEYAENEGINKIILTPGFHEKVIKHYKNNRFEEEYMNMVYTVTKCGNNDKKTKKNKTKNK